MTDLIIYDPQVAIQQATNTRSIVVAMTKENVLREGHDYGKLPGTEKMFLQKPGAEKLCTAFALCPEFRILSMIEDFETGLFQYRYECALIHIPTGAKVATGIGSCTTYESKYRWRWVSADRIRPGVDIASLQSEAMSVREPQFAIEKAETTGKFGKPAEYWQQFKDAIANNTAKNVPMKKKDGGTMPAWEITTTMYRIQNFDLIDQVNTVDKMAQKRSLVAAVLVATNASEFFTQDIEDMPEFQSKLKFAPPEFIEGDFSEDEPEPRGNGTQGNPPPPPAGLDLTGFWAAVRELGIKNPDALVKLGIKTMNEWTGTFEAALAKIKAPAEKKTDEKNSKKDRPARLGEDFIKNVRDTVLPKLQKAFTDKGEDWQLTLRVAWGEEAVGALTKNILTTCATNMENLSLFLDNIADEVSMGTCTLDVGRFLEGWLAQTTDPIVKQEFDSVITWAKEQIAQAAPATAQSIAAELGFDIDEVVA